LDAERNHSCTITASTLRKQEDFERRPHSKPRRQLHKKLLLIEYQDYNVSDAQNNMQAAVPQILCPRAEAALTR
jgi:hypothetical protein